VLWDKAKSALSLFRDTPGITANPVRGTRTVLRTSWLHSAPGSNAAYLPSATIRAASVSSAVAAPRPPTNAIELEAIDMASLKTWRVHVGTSQLFVFGTLRDGPRRNPPTHLTPDCLMRPSIEHGQSLYLRFFAENAASRSEIDFS